MYYTYVLYSKSHDKIYIGFTSNLEGRLLAHNHPKNKGWTSKHKPWILVHSEAFDLKPMAMKREKELKSFRGREYIWNIIATNRTATD